MSAPKPKELFLASSLRDGLEDNNINQVTTLLEHKEADPNILLPMHGISPFHLVIGNESETFAEEVTRLFLRHGGDPNVRSIDGMTPVHVAAAWGRIKVLELLLANGGDPLALDDEGRSPFHYAFDGSYYQAIVLLGQYCTKVQEEEEEEESSELDKPQIQIKLEKILVNRGDVVAEYVPSEIDLTEDSITTGAINTAAQTLEGTFSEGSESRSASHGDPPSLHSDNITLRRYQTCRGKKMSPMIGQELLGLDKERSAAEEKILIGQIIHRLSDSFNKAEKENFNLKEKESISNGGKKKFCSLLPKPKYFKKNLETPKKEIIFPAHLDNSIISTSPNFRIGGLTMDTTPTQRENMKFRNNYTPKNFYSPSIRATSVTPQVKSASSTPKKSISASRGQRVGKRVNEKINKTPLNKTYKKSDVLEFSPEVEKNLKMVNRRLLSKEFAKRLEKSFDDDDIEDKIEDLKGKNCNEINNAKYSTTPSLNNNIEVKNAIRNDVMIKSCNSPLKKLNDKNDNNIIRSPVTPTMKKRQGKINQNIPVKCEGSKLLFESPGSSNPRSLTSSPKRESTSEEKKLLNEIDEIYREKGRTPRASVSGMTNDSLNEASLNSENTSSTMDTTFSPNVKKFSERDSPGVTKDSENFSAFRTPLRSTMSSRCSTETFFSVDEEYAYVDPEKNVAFLERRLRVLPPSKCEDMNNVVDESTWIDMFRMSMESTSSVPASIGRHSTISVDHYSLRYRLIALGEVPGPITDTTFNVYLKRLRVLERTSKTCEKELVPRGIEPPLQISLPKNFSKELLSVDWTKDHQKYKEIEHDAFKEYERPSAGRNYRGGIAKVSFNYLLLDPRVTNDLPRTGNSLSLAERWKIFLEAIFYVGKGKSARPAAHLYEAFDLWTGKKRNNQPNDKLKRIMEIWKSGQGVVSLQVFSNSMQEEAFTREAAMIDALGSTNLSNCLRGQYYGIVSTMNMAEKKMLGKFLLYNAMQIFMHEGERQLFPRNVE
ncbi:uncharacterized protein [Fopius arisanus]|uniref:Uncharacterized protein isoform X2 n=1 Tax=Fopius arisanus TaxID=64838 RepID=A0A9R1TJT1_9HYME|nr:PREDICTED: uncharacterized protein LOC105270744 isoform X2 [Fopius arisanus]